MNPVRIFQHTVAVLFRVIRWREPIADIQSIDSFALSDAKRSRQSRTSLRWIRSLGAGLLTMGAAHGQVDIRNNPINKSHGDRTLLDEAKESANNGQFVGMAGISAGGARDLEDQDAPGSGPAPELKDLRPNSDGKLILQQSFFGGSFSGSIPDYFFGDVIPPPLPLMVDHDDDDDTPDLAITFRARPILVDPGKPATTPAEAVKYVTETTPSEDAADFTFPADYAELFYWSKHAEQVLASESGRMTIYWQSVDRIREEDGANVFLVKAKTYSISAGSTKEPRKIYWTEGRFEGPPVAIPGGVVQEAKPIYNTQVKEFVDEEEIYVPSGGSGEGLESWTIRYDEGAIRAYNKEGRVLIEYLGQPRDPADPSVREHLGYEVVDIIQERAPVQLDLYLGEPAQPSDGVLPGPDEQASPNGRRLFDPRQFTAWEPPSLQKTFLNKHQVRGKAAYYGVEKNNSANEVQLFWLHASPEGNLGIEWPVEFNSYLIDWPEQIDGFFALNARPADDAFIAPSALHLPQEAAPQLVFQDDESGQEARLDQVSSELEMSFLPNGDHENRSLVLLSSVDDFWYLRVYSYLEENLDSLRPLTRAPLLTDIDQKAMAFDEAQSDLDDLSPDDSGYGTALTNRDKALSQVVAARDLLYRFDNFLSYHLMGTVAVGERVPKPPNADSVAGYISAGMAYNPGAYISPLADSVPAAEAGAIIPVNARPGLDAKGFPNDKLMIWWYVRHDPPSAAFDPIYVPSIVGEYQLVWPGEDGTTDVSEIVLAANAEPDDLPPAQQNASLYAQNDPDATGYNPNEEHAIKYESKYYAIRDDLAVYDGDKLISSRPYVLIDHLDPIDSRPAMRAWRVLREKDGSLDGSIPADGDLNDPEDTTFRYNVVAPKILQGPLPLSVMPEPLIDSVASANKEVTAADLDPASRLSDTDPVTLEAAEAKDLSSRDPSKGTAELKHYNRFTFKDRKERTWIYRGPHDPGSIPTPPDPSDDPAIGMQFYYNTLEGFDFPDAEGKNAAPEVGTIVPYLRPYATLGDPDSGFDPDNDPASVEGTPLTIEFVPFWPDDSRLPEEAPVGDSEFVLGEVAILNFGETLTRSKNDLPQVRGNSSVEILYQQSVAKNVTDALESVVLYDPTVEKVFEMGSSAQSVILSEIPPSIATTNSRGKTFFQFLPPHLQERFFYDPAKGAHGALVLRGSLETQPVLDDFLLPNVLSSDDILLLKNLGLDEYPKRDQWISAIDGLATTLHTFRPNPDVPGTYLEDPALERPISGTELAAIVDSDTAVASYAIAAVDGGEGYVTIIQQNGRSDITPQEENPEVKIFKVGDGLYEGQVIPIEPSNPLGDQVSLQFTGDFAGRATLFDFEWRYTPPVNSQQPALPGAPDSPTWFPLGEKNTPGLNRNVFGGGAQPLLTLGDNYLTMRYRPGAHHGLYPDSGYPDDETGWSTWTEPALVEGWIKRVLAGINPFNQRLGDFFDNAVDTDISLLTQAGTRWEGDVALTLDNLDDVGLIELYETVLNRGISLSIDGAPPVDYGPANDALLLAAGYLADLYQILGDEAFADAANPMVLFDTQSVPLVADSSVSQGFEEFFRETATSRFAFEGQVPNLMEEELVLLRGRDDTLAPGVEHPRFYNRFAWNYTRGIDAGEVVYALNYNIRERQDEEADGVIDANDAARQFPMGHGDAYGHYLMALKNYYRLLTDPQFSWAPRAEDVNVLGVPVAVDYLDERKFGQAAVSLGRTANQILSLERRKSFREDSSGGWSHLRDETPGKTIVVADEDEGIDEVRRIDPARGVDGTAARAAQGSYFHWVVANSLLPEVDPVNQGIQKIDRSTVPELDELPLQGEELQQQVDEANLFVNPLGLTAESLLFDLSPGDLAAGKTHYEQIYERSVRSLGNAFEVFDRARESTQLLRALGNQSEDFATAVFDEERAFTQQLREIYGVPYPGDLGPGKAYDNQEYDGPDTKRFMYIDPPYHFEDPTAQDLITFNFVIPGKENNFVRIYDPANPKEIPLDLKIPEEKKLDYTVQPNSIAQFASPGMGRRPITGQLQDALLEMAVARTNLLAIATDHDRLRVDFDRQLEVFAAAISAFDDSQTEFDTTRDAIKKIEGRIAALRSVAGAAAAVSNIANSFIGVTNINDIEFFDKFAAKIALGAITLAELAAAGFELGANINEPKISVAQFNFEKRLEKLGFGPERKQMVWELEQAFDAAFLHQTDVDFAIRDFVQAQQRYQTLLTEGERIKTAREIFRKRAAAITQGYRTRDVAFRTFRTEALEQYQGLLDWATKYAYLTARAYDYETGLLGEQAGQDFLNKIVASRSLGIIGPDGSPQFAGSDTGDPGLSGLLKQLDGDWNVVKGRLGFNNPDTYGTTFSLRREHFRLPVPGPDLEAPEIAAMNKDWKARLEASFVKDLRSDPDIAAHALQIEGSAVPVPGMVLKFNTTIQDGKNFFGERLMAGDHAFSPTSFATKIHSVGVVLKGYRGMDPCLVCPTGPGPVTSDQTDALSATPYVYLIPTGRDVMRTPPFGDGTGLRSWQVHDHALPLPFNIGASAFSDVEYWNAAESLTEPFFQPRKHQAFRAVDKAEFFFSGQPEDFTNRRLVGRSVWNTEWKLVIPGQGLLADPIQGIDKFIRTVSDVQLYLKTYSYSGN